MEFDWRSIAGAVAPHAPKIGAVLGTALGGPIGATIGGLAGSAIAVAFGVEETPEAVGRAIAEDPKAAEKLERLESERGQEILAEAQVRIEELKQQTEQDRIAAADVQDARQFNLDLTRIGSAQSWGVSILATVFTISYLVILVVAMTTEIKENQILLVLIGGLGTGQTMILSYFFGSSQGSKNNADRFAQLANTVANKPNPSPAAVEMVKAATKGKK